MNLLTLNSHIDLDDKDDIYEYQRPTLTVGDEPFEQVLNLQQGKRPHRKISPDYVKIIELTERAGRKNGRSLRSFEYAKTRPFLTISQYQLKNQEYQKQVKGNNHSQSSRSTEDPKISSARNRR